MEFDDTKRNRDELNRSSGASLEGRSDNSDNSDDMDLEKESFPPREIFPSKEIAHKYKFEQFERQFERQDKASVVNESVTSNKFEKFEKQFEDSLKLQDTQNNEDDDLPKKD